ncbi:MAG: hypothetical protein C4325_00860 [Blastocatellia bacterium]
MNKQGYSGGSLKLIQTGHKCQDLQSLLVGFADKLNKYEEQIAFVRIYPRLAVNITFSSAPGTENVVGLISRGVNNRHQ